MIISNTFYNIEDAINALKSSPDSMSQLSVHERIEASYGFSISGERDVGLARLQALMEILSSPVGKNVKTLNLSYMKLGSRGAELVAGMLKSNDTLEKLIVYSSRLGSKNGIGHDWDRPYGSASGCQILVDAKRARSAPLTIDFGCKGGSNWLTREEIELVESLS